MAGERRPIVLGPEQGRTYDMGGLKAVFKADGEETGDGYAVSEWWMEPGFEGVGAHSHDANDEVFVVIEGAPSVLVGEEWLDLQPGAFVRVPATVIHDFRNGTDKRAGLLNVFIPGGFEPSMPSIAEWFATHRAEDQSGRPIR
jgi:mannose-6-phosphate isomerase-like protein (cupin superfamily)